MKSRDISEARNPDLRASEAALRRAAQLARQTAIQTDTDLVVVRNGRTIRIPAHTLRYEAKGDGSSASMLITARKD
ncbi:hypothetical protein [Salinisphaera japonica]|uniref:Uncharacterized protein n=1 Tax=Salinisphaera japonica YTM-1 TaxID=1209778 RepID=A0A423Q077_9GAMM|nr:hypothetical protein [Salinisphaera japonica]ROO31400.1 hypothetical protein SAJA_02640 [Salinisphaera japonica YTM-1]